MAAFNTLDYPTFNNPDTILRDSNVGQIPDIVDTQRTCPFCWNCLLLAKFDIRHIKDSPRL
jgi:hypothetical protein